MRHSTAVIIGGGLSGLTTAYDLERVGVDCLVVEKEKRLGGLISTEVSDGFVMDLGPDAFLAQKPWATALCNELGIGSDIISTNPENKKVYVLFCGQLHPLPEGMKLTVPTRIGPLFSSSLFSPLGKIRMFAERFIGCRKMDKEESIASFVSRRFGSEALERVAEPLLAGIHCGDVNRLSMDLLFPRLVDLERSHRSLTLAMSSAGSTERDTGFLSLVGGMSSIVRALQEKLPVEHTLIGTGVIKLSYETGGFVTTLNSGERIRSEIAVVAAPIRVSEAILKNSFPKIAANLQKIPTASSIVVLHGFEQGAISRPLDAYGFVVPKHDPSRLRAATFVTSKFEKRAPGDALLIRTFLGGPEDPDVLELSDPEVAELSLKELSKVLGTMGPPLVSRVVRYRDRTPQVELGHAQIVSALEEASVMTPGLYVIGNGIKGVGIPECVREARQIAKEIAALLSR